MIIWITGVEVWWVGVPCEIIPCLPLKFSESKRFETQFNAKRKNNLRIFSSLYIYFTVALFVDDDDESGLEKLCAKRCLCRAYERKNLRGRGEGKKREIVMINDSDDDGGKHEVNTYKSFFFTIFIFPWISSEVVTLLYYLFLILFIFSGNPYLNFLFLIFRNTIWLWRRVCVRYLCHSKGMISVLIFNQWNKFIMRKCFVLQK